MSLCLCVCNKSVESLYLLMFTIVRYKHLKFIFIFVFRPFFGLYLQNIILYASKLKGFGDRPVFLTTTNSENIG